METMQESPNWESRESQGAQGKHDKNMEEIREPRESPETLKTGNTLETQCHKGKLGNHQKLPYGNHSGITHPGITRESPGITGNQRGITGKRQMGITTTPSEGVVWSHGTFRDNERTHPNE